MAVRGVDSTSPETAYASKPNIVYPGPAAHKALVDDTAAAQAAAQGVQLGSPGTVKGVTDAAERHASTSLTDAGSGVVSVNHDRVTQGS